MLYILRGSENYMFMFTVWIVLSTSMTKRSVSVPTKITGLPMICAAVSAVELIRWFASAVLWLHEMPAFFNVDLSLVMSLSLLWWLPKKWFWELEGTISGSNRMSGDVCCVARRCCSATLVGMQSMYPSNMAVESVQKWLMTWAAHVSHSWAYAQSLGHFTSCNGCPPSIM